MAAGIVEVICSHGLGVGAATLTVVLAPVVALAGVMWGVVKVIRGELAGRFDSRFDAVDARFDGVDTRLDAMDEKNAARFEAVETRFGAMDARFDSCVGADDCCQFDLPIDGR